jgi:hypothetical protein
VDRFSFNRKRCLTKTVDMQNNVIWVGVQKFTGSGLHNEILNQNRRRASTETCNSIQKCTGRPCEEPVHIRFPELTFMMNFRISWQVLTQIQFVASWNFLTAVKLDSWQFPTLAGARPTLKRKHACFLFALACCSFPICYIRTSIRMYARSKFSRTLSFWLGV